MTHPQVKTKISAQYLSIEGIGYINHAHLLEVFGIKPQDISQLLISSAGHLGNSVFLIGDTADIETYLSAEAVLHVAKYHPAPFAKDEATTELYACVMDSLIAVSQLDTLEKMIETIKQEQGIRFVPPVCTLSEVHH